MNWNQLQYVITIAEEKSITKAAQKLYISQPSLSASIRRIEARIGAPIFDRSTTPISLTECGEEYIACVKQILSIQNGFENYLNLYK